MIKKAFQISSEMLKGHKFETFGIFVFYMILTLICSITCPNFGLPFIIVFLLLMPLSFGIYYYFMNMRKGTQKLEDLYEFFVDFKTGCKLLFAMLWYMFIVTIGMILFIVPGIIWSYRYVMIFYLLIENRDMTIKDAFKKSKEIMHGHKFKYFIATMIVMLIPMAFYLVGGIGLSMSTVNLAAYKDSIKEETIASESLEEVLIAQEEILADEDATLEELESLTEDVTVAAPNYLEVIMYGGIFGLGLLMMILVAPRCQAVQTGYYFALTEKKKTRAKKAEKVEE